MVKRLILYTSQSEGITLGVQADTWMDCLLELTEEFGDGVMPLYERTKEELSNVSEAVAETFKKEMKDIAEELGREISRSTAFDGREDSLQVFMSEEDDEGDDQEDHGGEDAVDGTGGDAPVCEVCGSETTKDYASLTRLEHGEVRCPNCVP